MTEAEKEQDATLHYTQLIQSEYAKVNREYPLTNLAETIQRAMSGASITPSDMSTKRTKKKK